MLRLTSVLSCLLLLRAPSPASADDLDLFSSVFELNRLFKTELTFSKELFRLLGGLKEDEDTAQGADNVLYHRALRKFARDAYPDGPTKGRFVFPERQ